MNNYVSMLSDIELDILKSAIGRQFIGIVTSTININLGENVYRTHSSYSLNIKEGFIVLKNIWLETPQWLDYWNLSVLKTNYADGIEYVDSEVSKDGRKVMYSPPAYISIKGFPRINKIDVFQYNEESNDEKVTFDKAVVFHDENGNCYCFSAADTISDAIDFTWDNTNVENMLKGSKIRCSIT